MSVETVRRTITRCDTCMTTETSTEDDGPNDFPEGWSSWERTDTNFLAGSGEIEEMDMCVTCTAMLKRAFRDHKGLIEPRS